ncbi:MAG: vitamin K epoxide reductase family protein [Candidatus Acidiferrum sp.]
MELVQHDARKAEELGVDLRHSSRKFLRRRRGIFGLYLTASFSMGVVALYQLGILERLPDPPLPHFNSGKVTGSAKAYTLFETPDGVLAIGSYAATMTLAAMGSSERARTRPLAPIALAMKVGFDAVLGARYAYKEWSKRRTLCFWCLAASAAVAAALPLAIPEARASLRRMKGSEI